MQEKPILPWEQSTFVKGCPIYTVTIDDAVVLRIEYSRSCWLINVLGRIRFERVGFLKISDDEKAKVIAESLLIETIENLKAKIQICARPLSPENEERLSEIKSHLENPTVLF